MSSKSYRREMGRWVDQAERLRADEETSQQCRNQETSQQMSTTLPQTSAARKEYPVFRGVIRYFPAAIAGAARVSKAGNDKHNPGQEMHHARGKSMDHGDCIQRHLMESEVDCGGGFGIDPDDGLPHVDKLVWRAMAYAQEWHEAHDGAPLPPGAKL